MQAREDGPSIKARSHRCRAEDLPCDSAKQCPGKLAHCEKKNIEDVLGHGSGRGRTVYNLMEQRKSRGGQLGHMVRGAGCRSGTCTYQSVCSCPASAKLGQMLHSLMLRPSGVLGLAAMAASAPPRHSAQATSLAAASSVHRSQPLYAGICEL